MATGTKASIGPPGCSSSTRPKRPFRAHVARGANLALESASDFREALDATLRVSRFAGYADPPLRRVLLFQGLGLAASRRWSRARSGFRALRERGAIFPALQPARLRSSRRRDVW